MIPPKLTKVTQEQLPGAPSWVNILLQPINLFFEQTWNCLTNLTIGDNVTGQFSDFRVQTGASYSSGTFPEVTIRWPFRKGVQSVSIAKVVNDNNPAGLFLDPVTIPVNGWVQTSNGIKIRYITGLEDSSAYTVRILAL